jgi:hypothetical protein
MKLTDLGYYSSQIDGRETGVYYDSFRGVCVTIKSLTLYSGSTTLDSITKLQLYAALQNVRTTNQGSEDLNRFDLLNGISTHVQTGSSLNPAGGSFLTMQPLHKDYNDFYATPNHLARHNNQLQVTDVQENGASGTIVLSKYLEMLRSIPVLPMIPDLRLVIDWNKDIGNLYQDTAVQDIEGLSVAVIRPQLIVEEIIGIPAQKGLLQIPYLTTMVEEFNVPAVANGASATSSFRSGAYRQRFVKDIVYMNENTSVEDRDWVLHNTRVMAQHKESLQLVVNGKKYLPDQGINNEAMRMQYFNDTLGSLNMPLLAYLPTAGDEASFNIADEKLYFLQGQFSPTAVALNSVIDRLDIEVTRTGNNSNTGMIDAYKLVSFGRINRLLELNNGQIRLSY